MRLSYGQPSRGMLVHTSSAHAMAWQAALGVPMKTMLIWFKLAVGSTHVGLLGKILQPHFDRQFTQSKGFLMVPRRPVHPRVGGCL